MTSCPQASSRNRHDLLIGQIDPEALLDMLKVCGGVCSRVFAGFRPAANNLRNPPVRRRLADEIVHDARLFDAVATLWARAHPAVPADVGKRRIDAIRGQLNDLVAEHGGVGVWVALTLDKRRAARRIADGMTEEQILAEPAQPVSRSSQAESRTTPGRGTEIRRLEQRLARAREEVGKLKQERRELKQRLRGAESRLKDAQRNSAKSANEAKRARKEVAQHAKQVAELQGSGKRLERSVADQKKTIEQKEAEIHRLRDKLDARPHESGSGRQEIPADWEKAVEWLVGKGDDRSAIGFLRAMAAANPDIARPHEMLVEAYRRAGRDDKLCDECVWLANRCLKQNRGGEAFTWAIEALITNEDLPKALELARSSLRKIAGDDESAKSSVRRMMHRIRIDKPGLHEQVQAWIDQLDPVLSESLRQSGANVPSARLYRFTHGSTELRLSAPEIVDRINRNDTEAVRIVRFSLAEMQRSDPETRKAILDAVRKVDPDCVVILERKALKPIIVDASNVARHGQKPNSAKLDNIICARSELRRSGFFPAYIYADPSLQHVIDRQGELLTWAHQEHVLFASGAEADEEILLMANEKSCPVLTNDRMVEWDPENEVPKYGFTIVSGRVSLMVR